MAAVAAAEPPGGRPGRGQGTTTAAPRGGAPLLFVNLKPTLEEGKRQALLGLVRQVRGFEERSSLALSLADWNSLVTDGMRLNAPFKHAASRKKRGREGDDGGDGGEIAVLKQQVGALEKDLQQYQRQEHTGKRPPPYRCYIKDDQQVRLPRARRGMRSTRLHALLSALPAHCVGARSWLSTLMRRRRIGS